MKSKFASETIELLKKLGANEWITCYERAPVGFWVITSGLEPPASRTAHHRTGCWPFDPRNLKPGCTFYGEKISYERFGNSNSIEPLIIEREFGGIRPGMVEVLEEFRLFHNLFEDRQKKRHYKILPDGSDHEVIRIKDISIDIRATELKQFLAIKDMQLILLFDLRITYEQSLERQNLSEGKQPLEDIEAIEYIHTAGSLTTRQRSFERICGSKTIHGFSKKDSGIWPYNNQRSDAEQHEEPISFITGIDAKGKPVMEQCVPLKGEYLTPVFFRKEVLNKYYENSSKFSVEDGYLRCGYLWGISIDNDHEDYVAAFLGDLERDLPSGERTYWKSFNILPPGGLSETAFRRSFMVEFVSPSQIDLRFKDALHRLRANWKKKWGWDLYLPLSEEDSHCLSALRLPSTSEQREFDSQILNLAKVSVDSLNEAALSKYLSPIENEKGIAKLERFLVMHDVSPEVVTSLRTVQSIRSAASAHRKGKTYIKVMSQLGVGDAGLQTIFSRLLEEVTAILEGLQRVTPIPKKTDQKEIPG